MMFIAAFIPVFIVGFIILAIMEEKRRKINFRLFI